MSFRDDDRPKRRSNGGAVWGFALAALFLALYFLTDLFESGPAGDARDPLADADPARTLVIVSGSENETLEPIVTEYCAQQGWTCVMRYIGSVDIRLALEEETVDFDAVWPAHSRWISLGDRLRRVKHEASITTSPVVFGVSRPLAEQLGLVGRPVTTRELVDLVRDGRLRFLATSATQSNSGFSNYVAMLTALAGTEEVLTAEMLDRPELREGVRTILSGVQRSSGSSGWLKDLFLKGAAEDAYRAMVNYEAVLIETNQELERLGKPPLYALYPADGVAIADSPLGFVASPRSEGKEAFFLELQRHLLSQPAQDRLLALGRRTGFGGTADGADPQVFRANWGIDTSRVLSGVRFPDAPTIEKALALYQEVLRRPSLTVLCLDFSGSMDGEGETQLKRAIGQLFDPDTMKRWLLQPSERDQFHALRFSGSVTDRVSALVPAEIPDLAAAIQRWQVNGGTDIYACAGEGLNIIANSGALDSHTAAVILMTDGKSVEAFDGFARQYRDWGRDVPVFSITFGDASDTQLKAIAELTRARVFDGRRDLAQAFRHARGYN